MREWGEMSNLFKHKDLLIRLAWKEIRVRYKEPILGFLWALLVPLLLTLIFMFIFTKIVRVPIKGYPFFLFLATGLFPWNFFSLSVSSCVMSILEGGSLIKKIYFPREVIPLSIVFANALNFGLTLVVAIVFVVVLGVKISLWILLLPLAFMLQIILTSGLVLLISSLQVAYRDVKFIVEIMLPFWFYLTPIFYPLNLVAEISPGLFSIYALNPMVGLVSFYRVALLGDVYLASVSSVINLFGIIFYSFISSLLLLFIGYRQFKKREPIFADVVK